MLHLNSSQCLPACLTGDIADNINMTCLTCPFAHTGYFKECVTCPPTCLTCSGLLYTQCTTCVGLAQHDPHLFYHYHTKVDPASVVYQAEAATCIYAGTPIIYMPTKANSSSTQYSALVIIILINLGLTIFLDCIFKYKTNLLLTL